MIWLGLILCVMAVTYVLSERRRWPMDRPARAEAPGQFAALSLGQTHYRWDGPMRGPVAVCIHGLTSASYVWDPVAEEMAHMGFRVLRYDLYGRGLSDRPGGAQDRAFFLTQLQELLEDQGVEGDITLMGYSMGAATASGFAADEPERIARLILLAPAGLGHTPGPVARFCTQVPVLGDWVMRVWGGLHLRRTTRKGAKAHPSLAKIAPQQAEETRFRGFLPAVLSSLRNMLDDDQQEDHMTIANAEIPVLAIWGEGDKAIPLRAMGRLTAINRTARQVELKGADHALPVTHTAEVMQAIQGFLRDT